MAGMLEGKIFGKGRIHVKEILLFFGKYVQIFRGSFDELRNNLIYPKINLKIILKL